MQGNKSALELSRNCSIPIATVYRRLRELLQTGLIVQLDGSTRKEANQWAELYHCTFKRINIIAENGTVQVALKRKITKEQ